MAEEGVGVGKEERRREGGKAGAVDKEVVKEKLSERSWDESKKMWAIAGPAILTSVLQFSIGFVTVALVGHSGRLELASVTLAQGVIESFAYGILLGMASALETICGQAVGAGQMHMLGIYLQRSWIICGATSIALVPMYVFTSSVLKVLHQPAEISNVAGKYCLWALPQLFAYAVNSPMQKFFQAQSRVWVMTAISAVVLAFHVLLSWLLVIRLKYGLGGAAVAGNISWWLLDLAQICYLVSGCFRDAWTGFSLSIFESLAEFTKLSLASAVMLCVRVSNELGAGHPKAAKFSLIVTSVYSTFLGILFAVVVLASKSNFPKLFTDRHEVIIETSKLGVLLAATILLNSIQSVLEGAAVGAGWQTTVAFVNIFCYYLFGLPFSSLLGFKFNRGVRGIWLGVLAGAVLQTIVLMVITYQTNWEKEASRAEERIKTWGGQSEPQDAPQKYKDTESLEENRRPVIKQIALTK
ncbi:hypothetical protein ACLOJK_002888 [Asimina triloba]